MDVISRTNGYNPFDATSRARLRHLLAIGNRVYSGAVAVNENRHWRAPAIDTAASSGSAFFILLLGLKSEKAGCHGPRGHKLVKGKRFPDFIGEVRHVCASLRACALLLWPYMPDSADKIWKQLALDEFMTARPIHENLAFSLFKPKGKIKKAEPLFPRVE